MIKTWMNASGPLVFMAIAQISKAPINVTAKSATKERTVTKKWTIANKIRVRTEPAALISKMDTNVCASQDFPVMIVKSVTTRTVNFHAKMADSASMKHIARVDTATLVNSVKSKSQTHAKAHRV